MPYQCLKRKSCFKHCGHSGLFYLSLKRKRFCIMSSLDSEAIRPHLLDFFKALSSNPPEHTRLQNESLTARDEQETVVELLMCLSSKQQMTDTQAEVFCSRLMNASFKENSKRRLSGDAARHLMALVMGWVSWPVPKNQYGEFIVNPKRDWLALLDKTIKKKLPRSKKELKEIVNLYFHDNPSRRASTHNYRWSLAVVNTPPVKTRIKNEQGVVIDEELSGDEVLVLKVHRSQDVVSLIEKLYRGLGHHAFPQDKQPPYCKTLTKREGL